MQFLLLRHTIKINPRITKIIIVIELLILIRALYFIETYYLKKGGLIKNKAPVTVPEPLVCRQTLPTLVAKVLPAVLTHLYRGVTWLTASISLHTELQK